MHLGAGDGEALSNVDLVGVSDVVGANDGSDGGTEASGDSTEGISGLHDVSLGLASRLDRGGGRRRTTSAGDATLSGVVEVDTSLCGGRKRGAVSIFILFCTLAEGKDVPGVHSSLH